MEACPVCAFDELLYPLECSHKLCLKCVKGVCVHSGACPCCRAELSSAYKTRIAAVPGSIRDVGADIDVRIADLFACGSGAWAYSDRKYKSCWLYDENTQREIESASTAGLTGVDVTACGCVVRIDFQARVQVNTATRTRRRLRKVSNDSHEIKGIAGMPRAARGPAGSSSRHAVQPSAPVPLTARAAGETLSVYRARICSAFHVAGKEPRRWDEGKVQFNRRVREWAKEMLSTPPPST